MSLREKQLMKRRINREHNSNLRAGYVHVNEAHLHKTGIRGRKQYVVYAIVILLLVAALANLLVTVAVLCVLRIDHGGVRDIEMVPRGEQIRFLGDVEVERVHLVQNKIYDNGEGLAFGSNEGMPVVFKLHSDAATALKVNPGGIIIENSDNFIITDPVSGETVFTTDFKRFRFPETLDTFETKRLKTNKVVSYDRDLDFESGESKNSIVFNAGDAISLQARKASVNSHSQLDISTASALTLKSANGIVLKSFLEMPRQLNVHTTPESASPLEKLTGYKICMCAESEGLLFKIPGENECHDINSLDNPCV